jgi:death-on-curing protein
MTRFLTVEEVVELHRLVIGQSGGALGIRDLAGLDSSVAQPRMTFDGQDLYPTLVEKAAALAFSLIRNHPFVDGNKRIGHAAMATFLLLNGREVVADVDEQEKIVIGVAEGTLGRERLTDWGQARVHGDG